MGYFIRNVLQLSKRIEFNRRFGQSSAQQGTGQLVETLPGTSSRPTELGDSEIRHDRAHDVAFEMGTSFEGSDSALLSPQIQSYVHPPESPSEDWTPVLTGRRHTQHSLRKSRRGLRVETNTRPSTVRRQTQFATRLHRLKSGQASSNLKLLTLMNPASEVLKVSL